MVVYENIGGGKVKAYSDAGRMIRGGFPEGEYAEAFDPADAGRTYVETDRFVPTTPTRPGARRWSRLAIKTALAQAGMLSQALAYLAQVEIATGYSAAEALQDCDYIEEGYPNAEKWNALLDGAANALGKTRAEIDAFLGSIPQEGGV